MELQIRIQSFSDIITNSSSETFIVNATGNLKELCNLIREVAKENQYKGSWEDWNKLSKEEQDMYDYGSGMGGSLKITTWEDEYNCYKKDIPDNKKEQFTPEIWSLFYQESLDELKKQIWIDIDWSRTATINWILENLWVSEAYEGYFRKDPNTGQVIARVSEEEWEQLPKNERNEY